MIEEPIESPQPNAPVSDVQFRDITPDEGQSLGSSIEYRTLDAPHNTVYDAENDRVVGLPQTLNADETKFVMKRDIDRSTNFFAMQDVGGFPALGKGLESFFGSLPQVAGGLMLEKGESQVQHDETMAAMVNESLKKTPEQNSLDATNDLLSFFGLEKSTELPVFGEERRKQSVTGLKNMQAAINQSLARNDELVGKSQDLIERNKQYMAEAGLERPETGFSSFMYDIGQGTGSILTSIGLASVTRSPAPAAILFGAIQKSQVYQEARAAGKDPSTASNISNVAGVVEGSLEEIGLDRFMKGMKTNSAVKRFVEGFAVEATQESSQQAGEEALTTATGVRQESLKQASQAILYSGLMGGILGGTSSSAVGAFVTKKAEDQGFDKETAKRMGEYAEKNAEAAKTDMGEFIAKELAPIAADDKSAQEFMTLMQRFGNDQDLVDREALDPDERKVFDQYIEHFNSATYDKTGVEAVENQFFKQAVSAGVDQDEATAGAKLIGARADAASRALGITPEQWLQSHNLEVKNNKNANPQYDAGLDDEVLFQRVKQTGLINQKAMLDRGADGNLSRAYERYVPLNKLDGLEPVPSNNESGDGEYHPGKEIRQPIEVIYDAVNDLYMVHSGNHRIAQATANKQSHIIAFVQPDGKGNNIGTSAVTSIPEATSLSQDARGSITFGENETIINLFQGANRSTLLHELGHLFLRDIRAVANASIRPQVKNDWNNVKKWLGVKGDSLTEEQEEKFARGFEAYLREGRAPKPELQSIFDRFKEWLTSIYKKVSDLNVEISPDIRKVFDRMLGGDFTRSERLEQLQAERNLAEDYKRIAEGEEEKTLGRDTGHVFRDIAEIGGDTFVPVSTRLGNIDKKLKTAVRRFVFNTGLFTHNDRVAAKPFIQKVSKMSEKDYKIFDFALKNRDTFQVDQLVKKYGLEEDWQAVRDVLDQLYNKAKDVGIEINYLEDYFPRMVNRKLSGEYMAAIRGTPEWSEIKAALKEADPESTFTREEQAEFVNKWLRGFSSGRINLARSSFTKERTVDYVKPEWNKYYEGSMTTLMKYIDGINLGIEQRKLFGKSETDTENNIGSYVLGLVEQGVIKQKDEQLVKKMLKAVVEPTGTKGAVSWAKNASYIYVMGNPISAITQLQDLAFSLAKNGYFRTGKSLLKTVSGRQVLRKEDLGVDNILQEFADEGRSGKAVRKVFDAIGLSKMDSLGKEIYIDAAYDRLVSAAKRGSGKFNTQMQEIFGDQAEEVNSDLKSGNMSENVKYLLFSELSDVQPLSLAEMPVNYLRGGNGRIFYMLKTYTIKQIDIYRREIYSEIASGDKARMINGVSNLTRLAVAMMLMGMGTDALKDLILGRDFDIDSLVLDNALKATGFTKYQIYKSKTDGVMNTFWQTLFVPPIGAPIDDAVKDITKISKGKMKAKDAVTLSRVPVVGSFYYWWWGGGQAKKKK